MYLPVSVIKELGYLPAYKSMKAVWYHLLQCMFEIPVCTRAHITTLVQQAPAANEGLGGL